MTGPSDPLPMRVKVDRDDISSLRLLGIIGGLTQQPTLSDQPESTLVRWKALQLRGGAIHLVGYCLESCEGRVSTPVVTMDVSTRRCTTASGRVYQVEGQPGEDRNAAWVWEQVKSANGISDEIDVSTTVAAALAQGDSR